MIKGWMFSWKGNCEVTESVNPAHMQGMNIYLMLNSLNKFSSLSWAKLLRFQTKKKCGK